MRARSTRGGIVATMACLVAFSGTVAEAQQNPILTATQAPPAFAGSPYGYSPYGYNPYGPSPYGYGAPYQSYNPSVQGIGTPYQQQNQNGVPGQATQPGQVQLPLSQTGGGGGGSGGGGGGRGGGQGDAGGGGNAAQGASYDVTQDPSSPLYKRYERINPADQQIRPRVLQQIGRGKGIRRGFLEEAQRLRVAVEGSAAARLDAHYDFSRLMIGEHLVPPVIGEVRGVQERGGDKLLYLTVGAFQIVRAARLVLHPPNWRDYLFIETAEPQTAISALAPETGEEHSIYDRAYDEGLAKGIEEARQTFEDNLNRLDRDYSGMERYQELAKQGAVSLPVVKDAKRAVRVAENGQRAFIGEQIVTLRVSPKFKAARSGAFK